MSRGFPSMTALLGLLAIAGYQNRDKIAEMLRGLGQEQAGSCRARWHRRRARPAGQQSRRCQCRRGPQRWARRTPGPLQAERPRRNCGVPGLERAPTKRSRRPNSSGRSAPRCWTPCRNKQDCRGRSCSRDCPANFPTQSTSTRRKAVSRRKRSFRVPKDGRDELHGGGMGILILSPMGAGIADRGSGWRPPPSIRRSLLLRRLLRRARCAVRSAKPSPVGLDIQAWFLVPLEKFLKQHLFFIIVQHRIKAFSFPLSMPGSLAPIAGRIVVADVAGSPGWARRLRRSRLLRVQIGRRVCSSTPCLLRSAADLGTGGGFGSRHLFSPAVAFPRRRVRRGTVGAGPFEPFRAVLRRGVCSHHRGNCNHSGKHAESGCYCHILPRASRTSTA